MDRTPDSLAPTLLLAMPQLRDKNFARSVVLLCEQYRGRTDRIALVEPFELRFVRAPAPDTGVEVGDVGPSGRAVLSDPHETWTCRAPG